MAQQKSKLWLLLFLLLTQYSFSQTPKYSSSNQSAINAFEKGLKELDAGDRIKAIPYFEKATQFAQANTGKSEFYKAMCLISIGKKDQACNALQVAKQKNYPNVDQFITSNCK